MKMNKKSIDSDDDDDVKKGRQSVFWRDVRTAAPPRELILVAQTTQSGTLLAVSGSSSVQPEIPTHYVWFVVCFNLFV